MNTKSRLYKLTNLTVFDVSLKSVPSGCKDAVSIEHLLKNHTVNCVTFEEKTGQS